MSHIDNIGEWNTRHISFKKVFKSMASQISVGVDLSKISLPAIIHNPYSGNELVAWRYVSYNNLFTDIPNETDPLQRFMKVVQWYLSVTQREKFEKKPHNAILAEWHYAWVDSENGRTDFVVEQTVHHPPVSSFHLFNDQANIRAYGSAYYTPIFQGTSIAVAVKGPLILTLGNLDEEYIISQTIPNIAIKGIVFGTKRTAYEGSVTVTCKKTGYQTTLQYKEKSNLDISVSGMISTIKDDKPLYELSGKLSDKIYLKEGKDKKTILDFTQMKPATLKYLPVTAMDDQNSLKVWSKVNQAIVDNNVTSADEEKRVIEEAQRLRKKNDASFVPRFFKLEDGCWVPTDKETRQLLEDARSKASL